MENHTMHQINKFKTAAAGKIMTFSKFSFIKKIQDGFEVKKNNELKIFTKLTEALEFVEYYNW